MRFAIAALVLLAACDQLPRDAAGTDERVVAQHRLLVGVALPTDPKGERFLRALERETGARIERRAGSLEPLLVQLERGGLDVVVGRFADDSGWRERVALTPPLDGVKDGDRPLAVHAAARNGENRWVMRLEQLARANAR